MWDFVWVSPQGHRSVSVSRHFFLQVPQCPCFMWKRFSRDHCCRGRSKPGCRIVGFHTRWKLTTWADYQLCFHRLLMSTGCKFSHSGSLDVSRSNGGLRISGWIGQLSCLTIFSSLHRLVLRSAGGSMLESTGSHRRGVGTRDQAHGRVQLHINLTCVSRAWPDWGAVLCSWIAKRQSRWPQSVGAGAPGGTGQLHQQVVSVLQLACSLWSLSGVLCKGVFIATQLDVELSCVAIDTSPTQLNSTWGWVELCRYRWVSIAIQLNSTDLVEQRTAKSVMFLFMTSRPTVKVLDAHQYFRCII